MALSTVALLTCEDHGAAALCTGGASEQDLPGTLPASPGFEPCERVSSRTRPAWDPACQSGVRAL
eukprot:scaffold37066_cov24-Phaeocystis_antarctica.AAC.1